MTETRQQVTH